MLEKLKLAQNKFMYFNYHAKVKKLIENGQATGFEFFEEYHKISPCLVIFFKSSPPMPIRAHKFDEYLFLLAKFGVEEFPKEKTEKFF